MSRGRSSGSTPSRWAGVSWDEEAAHAALEAQEQSGLSRAEFAEREGFDVQRLYYWRRRLEGKPTTTPAFVEVSAIRPAPSERIEIALRSGHVVRVPSGFDPATLRRVVAVLEESSSC